MQLKIKDIPNLIQGMDPEAVIYVNGGCSECATDDIEFVESNGIVRIQESTRLHTERYEIVDIPNDVTAAYDKLVLFKSYEAQLSDVIGLFSQIGLNDFSGVIVIDTMFYSGNNSNRFLKAIVTNGIMDPKSITIVETKRKTPIRVFSNTCIQQDPDRLEASVLTTYQKNLLLHGVSI